LTDDVFFDANSGTGTVTLNATPIQVLSLNTTGISTSLTINPQGKTLNVFGSLTLSANTTLASGANGFTINMKASATGKTVSCPTSTPIINDMSFGDSTGTVTTGGWTFTSSITASNIYLYTGALDTNGQTVTVGGRFGDAFFGTATRSLTLGASTINCGTVAVSTSGSAIQLGRFYSIYYSSTGMTFSAGTSTINIGSVTNNTSANDVGINWGFIASDAFTTTFNTVNIYGLQTIIRGTNTFANLSITAAQYSYAAGYRYPVVCNLYADQTVTGTLTLQGSDAAAQKLMVRSNVIGTPRTITATSATASIKTLKWVIFQDITLTNSGSALGPLTLVGDAGGNTFPASTFDTPIICYAKISVAGSYWSSAIWFTSSGGSTATRVPLPQDNAVFDSNTGNFYCQTDYGYLCGNLDTTGYAQFISNASGHQGTVYVYGELTMNNNQFQVAATFSPRRDINVSTIPSLSTTYSNFGFTTNLINNLTSSTNLSIEAGTFATNNYSITVNDFFGGTSSSVNTLPTINFGSSAININRGIYFNSGVTLNAGTSTVILNRTTSGISIRGTLSANGQTFNSVVFNCTNVPADQYPNIYLFSGTGCTISSITSTGTNPAVVGVTASTTWNFTDFNLNGTAAASILFVAGYSGAATGNANTSTATFAISNNSSTTYVAYYGITKSGAGALTAYGVANISRNSGITFPTNTVGLAYTGSVGSTTTGSFVVPANYAGSNLCIVYGGGGGSARRSVAGAGGGGSGNMSVFSNLNNISAGSTIYYQLGQGGAGATSGINNGTAGGTSWINTVSNTSPTTINSGLVAGGGSQSTTAGVAGSGATSGTSTSQILMNGGDGKNGENTSQSGGGGGGAPTLYALNGYAGGTLSNSSQSGGVGGGGARGIGSSSATSQGGNGGINLSSVAAVGGAAGVAGASGTLGGGGAGGGFATAANTSGGAGGGSGYGSEYFITQLNGVGISSTAFGGSGGGGGGGAGTGTGIGGAGGSPLIASGGGGSGGSITGGGVGNGGNGGVGAVIFLYSIPTTSSARSYGLLVG
jgi:hypothetical protein